MTNIRWDALANKENAQTGGITAPPFTMYGNLTDANTDRKDFTLGQIKTALNYTSTDIPELLSLNLRVQSLEANTSSVAIDSKIDTYMTSLPNVEPMASGKVWLNGDFLVRKP